MRILVYGINYSPELTGIGKYTGEMCEWLAARGHNVEVITAMPYYPKWKIEDNYKNKGWHTERINGVTVHRCPLFVTQKVNSKTRIIHELSFLLSSSIFWFRKLFVKYDLIISVYPPLIIGLYPAIYKTFRKTTWLFHIQDLQVDAAKELGMIKNQFLLNLLFKTERIFLNKADKVSSISLGMKRKIIGKGVAENKYLNLPNWVDLNFVQPVPKEFSLRKEMGFSDNDKVILYSGNLGEKQGLEMIITVAEKLKFHSNIYFAIAGDGAARKKLQDLALEKNLANVRFYELRPYKDLPALLSGADLHLILQKKSASDLVLPSKLNTILAVGGVAIVAACENTALYDLVSENNMGIVIEPENEEALYQAIINNIDSDNYILRENAKAFAENNINIDNILHPLTNSLNTEKITETVTHGS